VSPLGSHIETHGLTTGLYIQNAYVQWAGRTINEEEVRRNVYARLNEAGVAAYECFAL